MAGSCLGVYGGVLNQVGCESTRFHASAAGSIVQEIDLAGGQWEVQSTDDLGTVTTQASRGDASGGGALQSVGLVQVSAIDRTGSVWVEASGTGAANPTAHGIYRIVNGTMAPWVHVEYGNSVAGTYPGTVVLGTTPAPRYPALNGNGAMAFFWSVRDGSDDGVSNTTGIYSTTSNSPASFRRHADFTANFPDANQPADFSARSREPVMLYSLSSDGTITLALTLADGTKGIWRENAEGTLQTIVLPGDTVNDIFGDPTSATIEEVGSFVAAEDGALVFTAKVQGSDVAIGDEYRLFGVTAPPNTRIGQIAMTGEFWDIQGDPNVSQIVLHGGDLRLPDGRAAGPLGFYPGLRQGAGADSRVAMGNEGYGRTVRGVDCGEVLLLLENGRSQRLEKRLLDPMCVTP